jgi:quercetin dioxygenase-like cupin family protein
MRPMLVKALVAAIALPALAASAASAQGIEITRADERASMMGPGAAYTGPAVADMLFTADDASSLTAAQVTFAPGSRTAWHNHLAGQYLIVTSGVGWVQERGGPKREIRAGDVVWTPSGVAHWHGATPTSSMSHIAVWEFVDGSGGELFEHVGDDEYLAETTRD